MKSLKTVLEFRCSENTWHHTPRFGLSLFDYLWRVVGIQSHSHTSSLPTIFWKGRPEIVFLTIKRHEIHLFLSLFAHMYVCIGQKYSVSKALFSLLICMYTLTKWNILSNCLLIYSRKRIFHFGRVCWSWKTITYISAGRTRPLRQNISGQYRHTSWENAIHISHWLEIIIDYTEGFNRCRRVLCDKSNRKLIASTIVAISVWCSCLFTMSARYFNWQ